MDLGPSVAHPAVLGSASGLVPRFCSGNDWGRADLRWSEF